MSNSPQTWRPINYTWYQGNESFCCYATRLVGDNFKIEFFNHYGRSLHKIYLNGTIFDAMRYYTKYKYITDLLQGD